MAQAGDEQQIASARMLNETGATLYLILAGDDDAAAKLTAT